MPDPQVLPRRPRLRASPPTRTWWARALARTVEELTVDDAELADARRVARSGRLGATIVLAGMASAAVGSPLSSADPDPRHPGGHVAQVRVARLDDDAWRTFVTEAARESGSAAALEAGELPADLIERTDQAGVEVIPGPEAVETACDCRSWTDPCVHALAVLTQLVWAVEEDPWVLLLLRGRTREQLLAAIDAEVAGVRSGPAPGSGELEDARSRAARVLALAEEAPTGDGLADSRAAAYDEAVSRLL